MKTSCIYNQRSNHNHIVYKKIQYVKIRSLLNPRPKKFKSQAKNHVRQPWARNFISLLSI
jgi:hypothetical protein